LLFILTGIAGGWLKAPAVADYMPDIYLKQSVRRMQAAEPAGIALIFNKGEGRKH
jgi:hypothetical protein